MRVDIRFLNTVPSDDLVEHIHRQHGFALSRFQSRIGRLVIRLEDLNGPRGGVDKACRIEASGDFGVRVNEARADAFEAAINRALGLTERSIARAARRTEWH